MMCKHRQLVKDTKYIGDAKDCIRCGFNTFEYYYENPVVDKKDVLCVECKYELTPPELHLTTIAGHGIWNITQSRWEKKMGLKEFQECGWFIRKIVRAAAGIRRVPRHTGTEDIYLEFYGNIKCLRVRHKFYPISLGICNMDDCIMQPIGN
jgi:hypothetical protein